MTTTDPTLTAEYQRKVDEFVHREVVYCVSHLVSELIPAIISGEIGRDTPSYEDDAYALSGRTYWVAYANGKESPSFPSEREVEDWLEDHHYETRLEWDIEQETDEALEHWIVSNWLADKLEAKGEIIVRDFFGLTIWGRCCSGQATSMDGVIQEIYNDLHR